MAGLTFEKIEKDITERMDNYTHSAQPTGDEVIIAWLVQEVNRLNGAVGTHRNGNGISVNHKPGCIVSIGHSCNCHML